MPRNPYEQLQDVVVEPRQAFEDITTLILKCMLPASRRVRVHRGDGGVDLFTGKMGVDGAVEVYQVKYFVRQWGDSQKRQIREAYQTARQSKDYNLGKWTLCVPVRLSKEDLRWFDEWRNNQNPPVELMDGDDLTELLKEDRCAQARSQLREWGVVGLTAGGPEFRGSAFIGKGCYDTSGLTATIALRLENHGDRSARNIKAVITHSDTNCVAHRESDAWENHDRGRLNPRTLRYRHTLNPGDNALIMSIPVCPRTPMPLSVEIGITADDCSASTLHCKINPEQIFTADKVSFESGNPDSAPIDLDPVRNNAERIPPHLQKPRSFLT